MKELIKLLKKYYKNIIIKDKEKEINTYNDYIKFNKDNSTFTFCFTNNYDKIYIIIDEELEKINKNIINNVQSIIITNFMYQNHYDTSDSD